MDLDTALYHVMSNDLGIRVSSLDEAKILVNRVDFCDFVTAPISSTDIQNLL